MSAKSKTSKEPNRSICEVQSQIKYISEEKISKTITELTEKGIIKDYAYCVHDKDTYTNDDELENPAHKAGKDKEKHIHIMLRLNNSYKFSTVANWFELPVECVRIIKNSYNAACAYLIHRNNPEKYQYDPSEVKASFDYNEFLKELNEVEEKKLKNENSFSKLKKQILEEVQAGTLRGYNFHENYNYTERLLLRSYLDKAVNEIITTKLNQNVERSLEVIYINGDSQAGKTTYAKMIAKNRFRYYAVSGEDRDPLEDYNGQPAIVLDEIRPSSMKLANFLKLVDNNTESKAGARYHGKTLIECKLIIITSILPIDEFFKNLQDNNKETAVQIKRRCKTLLEMSRETIRVSRWDRYNRKYVYCGDLENPIPKLYKVEPTTVEDLRKEACEVLGIGIAELNVPPVPIEEPEGIIGKPIPLELVYPTIPKKDIAEIKKNGTLLEYLKEHPECQKRDIKSIMQSEIEAALMANLSIPKKIIIENV